MAGLRTNALVALGAALFELLAVQMTGVRGVNPTRIAAYVVVVAIDLKAPRI